jgi:hypothetical protein
MKQVTVKFTDEELEQLRDKANTMALTMSDYLRSHAGFQPFRRTVGRPGAKAPCGFCGKLIAASAFVKHVRTHHPGSEDQANDPAA